MGWGGAGQERGGGLYSLQYKLCLQYTFHIRRYSVIQTVVHYCVFLKIIIMRWGYLLNIEINIKFI
jgi:hypothetical protein